MIVRDNAGKRGPFVWHVARLVDWKYNLFNFKRRFPGNYAGAAHLWFNFYDELIGFVISEEFDEQFDIILLDEYEHLYPKMLNWACTEWGLQYHQLLTSAVEMHKRRIAALEQAGYQRTDEIEMTRIFDTAQFSDYPYPAAPLLFESMAENKNYTNQAALRRSAWPKLTDDNQIDGAIRAYIRTSPIYDARFDFFWSMRQVPIYRDVRLLSTTPTTRLKSRGYALMLNTTIEDMLKWYSDPVCVRCTKITSLLPTSWDGMKKPFIYMANWGISKSSPDFLIGCARLGNVKKEVILKFGVKQKLAVHKS